MKLNKVLGLVVLGTTLSFASMVSIVTGENISGQTNIAFGNCFLNNISFGF